MPNQVQNGYIADLSVTTQTIVNNAVTTGKIADLNVTTGKLADNAVTTGKIADLNVTTGKIADNVITAPKLSGGQLGTAPVYGVRAWVTFNGSDGSIIGSGNVSQVNRTDVGRYTIIMANGLLDTNYAIVATVQDDDNNSDHQDWVYGVKPFPYTMTTSQFEVQVSVWKDSSNSRYDPTRVSIIIMR